MKDMPYKLVDDFEYVNLSVFDKQVLTRVSGCPAPLYELERLEVLQEFCERTDALQGLLPTFEVSAGVDTYHLTDVPDNVEVMTVRELRYVDSGTQVNERAYIMDVDRLTLTLQPTWDTALDEKAISVRVSLQVSDTATGVEKDFYRRWGRGIAAGIIQRLCLIPNKSWTNPDFAMLYGARYHDAIASAKIAVSRNFNKYARTTVIPGGFS